MTGAHSRIIALAAKSELAALGFRQQGRSRLWLADRGSWLNVVEFTPSRWSKSVSLINAAHWLWDGAGFMSFNVAASSPFYVEFETDDQFRDAVSPVAEEARAKAVVMDERFYSFEAVADFVVRQALSDPERMGPSWWGYEAGIVTGLLGRTDEAKSFFLGLTDHRVIERAAHLLPLVDNLEAFRSRVNDVVAKERARLKLTALDQPLF